MNKKLFLFALPILCLVLVSAILVNYLSNSVSAEVEVLSPMVVGISDSEGNWGTALTLPVMYTGGENEVTFYTREENIADESITGVSKNIVTSAGIKCDDFESVEVSTSSNGGAYGIVYDLIDLDLCEQVNYNTIKFNYPNPLTWDAGQIDINKIVVTFNDVIGKYVFTSQVIPQ